MTGTEHRALGVHYFNAAWELIDLPSRTPEQDREMLARAFASRQHWAEAGGTDENLAVSDWQIAHAASLAGLPDVALSFAQAAVSRAAEAVPPVPAWLLASVHEGLARAYACAGDRSSYDAAAARCRELLVAVSNDEDRALVQSQLDSVPAP